MLTKRTAPLSAVIIAALLLTATVAFNGTGSVSPFTQPDKEAADSTSTPLDTEITTEASLLESAPEEDSGTKPEPENETSGYTPEAAPPRENNLQACSGLIIAQEKQYQKDVEAQKRSLNNKLSLRVGMNISGQYVKSYNENVNRLYEELRTAAESANCASNVAPPLALPASYPY